MRRITIHEYGNDRTTVRVERDALPARTKDFTGLTAGDIVGGYLLDVDTWPIAADSTPVSIVSNDDARGGLPTTSPKRGPRGSAKRAR